MGRNLYHKYKIKALIIFKRLFKMNTFYHVTRSNINALQEFTLQKFKGYIESPFFTRNEFTEHKNSLFPEGVSKHGEIYLHNVFMSVGRNMEFTPNELTLELNLDLIRRLKFPQRKSRFECSFGCLTLEDAIKLKTTTFGNQGEIYKVECDKFTIADMTFIRQGASVIGLQIMGEKYWNGDSSDDPFWEVLMENPVRILEKVELK